MRILTFGLIAPLLAGCATIPMQQANTLAQANLSSPTGTPLGTARLVSDGATLSVALSVSDLEPGEHGFHLHTTGRCEAPHFSSAGGHLNPTGNEHGRLNPQGSHLGDLPNLVVGASRTASLEADLGADTPARRAALFDADGTAVIVHAGPDDYRSDPAGNAGARIACGVLTRN